MLEQLGRAHEAEQKIRRWNQSLEMQVRERTTSLKQSRDQMEAFAYSVSHDLRAPLRSTHGFAEILVSEYADKLDSEGQMYLQSIAQSAQRMDRLIADLLHYSRVAQQEVCLSRVDLEPVRLVAAKRPNDSNRLPTKTLRSD